MRDVRRLRPLLKAVAFVLCVGVLTGTAAAMEFWVKGDGTATAADQDTARDQAMQAAFNSLNNACPDPGFVNDVVVTGAKFDQPAQAGTYTVHISLRGMCHAEAN